MIRDELITKAAHRLRVAETEQILCSPIRDLIGTQDIQAAYAIQRLNRDYRIAEGAKVRGHKIGLTAPVVQQQLGVNQPDFGLLWDDREIPAGGSLSVSEVMQGKVEAEVAFIMAREVRSAQATMKDIIEAVDHARVAIEIVGSRIENWDIKISDTIADNASASHWVIGTKPFLLDNLDLVQCTMQMYKHSELVSEGTGSACLGSPLIALQWLARTLVEMGDGLQAGDIVLSGALGPMVNIKAGDYFTAHIQGLDQVSIAFTE